MKPTIQLMITCLLDTIYPETGEAVVRLLERAGVTVQVPAGQTCCGQPTFNAGLRAEARPIAIHTIQVFEKAPGDVVVPSGSCAGMIRTQYPELFADDPLWLPRAQALARRTYELTEYLVDVLGVTDLGAHFQGTLTYHASCHLLRELGVHRQPLALLAAVRGAKRVDLPGEQECCGFGGLFSVEQPEISAAMVERKIANVESTGAEVMVACDSGCVASINGALRRQGKPQCALYIADFLASSR